MKQLRLKDIDIAAPAGRAPDCQNCFEICCTGPHAEVTLRLEDIARLKDLSLESHITHDRILKTNYFESKKTYRELVAQESIYSQVFPKLTRDASGTCKLLDAERNCSIYPNWPLSCARYPYALNAQNRVIFWAKGCQSTKRIGYKHAHPRLQKLAVAALESYNARIRDIILLFVARDALNHLGLLEHLNLKPLEKL